MKRAHCTLIHFTCGNRFPSTDDQLNDHEVDMPAHLGFFRGLQLESVWRTGHPRWGRHGPKDHRRHHIAESRESPVTINSPKAAGWRRQKRCVKCASWMNFTGKPGTIYLMQCLKIFYFQLCYCATDVVFVFRVAAPSKKLYLSSLDVGVFHDFEKDHVWNCVWIHENGKDSASNSVRCTVCGLCAIYARRTQAG